MFQPEPDVEEFYSYSSAGPLKSVGIYAQDGAGQSLGMAYQLMYNRFRGFMGFGNRYNYYNPYYYGGYYNDYVTYDIIGGSYTILIPGIKVQKPRKWSRDSKSSTSNLRVTRTRTNTNDTNESNYNSNSSNVSGTRSSSSLRLSSNTRVTRRN
jgi:hypothetical protein